MISRCPSCGATAPDEARLCQACGWDFVANKKGKAPEAGKKAEPPASKPPLKPAAPPPAQAGFSLPPARGGEAPPPVKPTKGGSGAFASPPGDENPFALPVARNLGPKPGESLFAPPPPPPAAKLPEAKPKSEAEKAPVEPLKKLPPKKTELDPAPPPVPEEEEEEQPKGVSLPSAAAAPEPAPEVEEAADEAPPPALFLPTSTKEIVVEAEARRPPAERPAPKPERAPASKPAPTEPPKKGRQSAVQLAALAGGALGLLSMGAIFMMLRTEPQGAARPTGASPFGKRAAGEATVTPSIDDPITPRDPNAAPVSPMPAAPSDGPAPTNLPAPSVGRTVEPPKPGSDTPPVAAPAPVAPPPAPPAPIVAPAPAPVTPSAPVPSTPVPDPSRPTATFNVAPRPKPPAPTLKPKPKPAAPPAPVKPKGPQWTFEGTVYDLLTTRGVFGVKLVFVDAEDNEVASTETGTGGNFSLTMPAGPANGYQLRIIHDDYSGKHIDELDSTSSVRKADLEQRKFLLQAGARNLPWIGAVGKPVRRDMALVPRVAAE
ncbi:MAG: hypothetical protein HY923_03365 [Elusimicrobia bacterium]|nr:hypothetical protein [Elusimicrobiota bacterium]